MKKRNDHAPELKAKVAIEAIRDEMTVVVLIQFTRWAEGQEP